MARSALPGLRWTQTLRCPCCCCSCSHECCGGRVLHCSNVHTNIVTINIVNNSHTRSLTIQTEWPLSRIPDLLVFKQFVTVMVVPTGQFPGFVPVTHLFIVSGVRSEAWTWRQIFLDAAVYSRTEVQLHVESLLRVRVLGWILIEHDDDLGHVVELGHEADILHGAAPLLVLHPALHEAAVGEDGQQAVDVRLGCEVESGPELYV